jgi:hypothetical protein
MNLAGPVQLLQLRGNLDYVLRKSCLHTSGNSLKLQISSPTAEWGETRASHISLTRGPLKTDHLSALRRPVARCDIKTLHEASSRRSRSKSSRKNEHILVRRHAHFECLWHAIYHAISSPAPLSLICCSVWSREWLAEVRW